MAPKIERMRIHFKTIREANERLHIFWGEDMQGPRLMGKVLVDHIWRPADFDPNMELVITYQPLPAAGGLATARLPKPVGLVRGRLLDHDNSTVRPAWNWLYFAVRFGADEGPEVFGDEQVVQFTGDTTGTKNVDLARFVEDETIATEDYQVAMSFGEIE